MVMHIDFPPFAVSLVRAALMALLAVSGFTTSALAESASDIRVASVRAPVDSGLLAALFSHFEQQTGHRVHVYAGGDAYDRARAGEADLVISHYGKGAVQSFVAERYGIWAYSVFASKTVLIGPDSDPAGIRGLNDPFEALRRIIHGGHTLLLGKSVGIRYTVDVMLAGIEPPESEDWRVLTDASGARQMRAAEERGAYTLLHAAKFSDFKLQHESGLVSLTDDPPLFHRILVAVPVNPAKVDGVNAEGAQALIDYLLEPATQVTIARFREAAEGRTIWAPAWRHNHSKGLVGHAARTTMETKFRLPLDRGQSRRQVQWMGRFTPGIALDAAQPPGQHPADPGRAIQPDPVIAPGRHDRLDLTGHAPNP